MKTRTTTLVSLGLSFLAYSTWLVLGVASASGLIPAVAGIVACFGGAAVCGAPRFRRKSIAIAVLLATTLLFLGGAAQVWLFAIRAASWPEFAIGLVFMGVAVVVFRLLGGRIITKPYEPPDAGPLAPA